MRYVVVRADRESGEDVEVVVNAASEAAARVAANRRGILIATCTPAEETGSSTSRAAAPEGSSERPNQLQPGEQDTFFDPAVLGLLRRQVEPEQLLMACDLRQPTGKSVRTALLTPTQLVFVGVTNQNGQRSIANRRELKLSQIDQITSIDQPAATFKAATTVIEIASTDRIET